MNLKNSYFYYWYYGLLTVVILYLILTKSILGDETGTVWVATQLSYSDIFSERYIGDFNPFGYFLINKVGYDIFGMNSFIFKIIPLLFYIGSIFIFYKVLVELKFEINFIKISTAFFTILPLNFFFSQFDRAYSFLLLFSLIMFYLSILIKKEPSKKLYFLYILALTVGLYTHFFVGLFTAIIFMTGLFFKELREKRFIITILVLNIISLVIFTPELLSFLEKIKDVISLEQQHTSQGYIKKLAFVVYGAFFGDTLAPINIFIISLVGISFAGILYGVMKNLNVLKDRVIQYSMYIFIFSIFLISSTGFARPMYIVFVTPFIAYILAKLFYEYEIRLPIFVLLGLFLFSNFNFITSNSNYFVSPQYSLDYKYYYGEFLNESVNKNTLIVISPSYNRSSFILYKSVSNDVIFINPFENIENQLVFDVKKYKKVIIFQEFHNQDIFDSIDKYLSEFKSKDLVDKQHIGFINKQEYSYFKVMEYIR